MKKPRKPDDSMPWLYCFLPGGNRDEFAEIDAELQRRGVIYDVAEHLPSEGRVYRVHLSCLSKLPQDEKGPYLGDDDSGHALHKWPGPVDVEPWKRIVSKGTNDS